MIEQSVIGQNVFRVDALEKVTGAARFTSDEELKIPGLLYGKYLGSPHPHAKIINLDTSKAERLPGVKAVITGKDVPQIRIGGCVADRHLLAKEVVRFTGDAVAVVAADSPEVAENALELVKVKYEELPAIFDAEEAMRPDCPTVLHLDLANYERPYFSFLGQDLPAPNVHTHHKIRRGNIDEGFQKADLVVENRFSTPRMVNCQLESNNAFAYVESDGALTVWSSTHQLFTATQPNICRAFDMPPSKVKIKARYIGGSFGNWPQAERFAALLALKTGKPVRVDYSREDCFIEGLNRFSSITYLKDGVKSDGTLLAREVKIVGNGGAYANWVPLIIRNGTFGLSTYRVPNLKSDAYGVYTNEPPSGPLRGFGVPQLTWALEQQMDIIAEKLGMNPVDFRRKNIILEGEENVRGEITESIAIQDCLDKVLECIKWDKPSEAPGGSLRKGKGFAIGNKYSIDSTPSSAVVKVHSDGTIELRHGNEEVGQGLNTILSQIVAQEFNVGIDKVKLVWGDTSTSPFDFGAVSSRSTFNTGNAVRLACQEAKRKMFEIAATILGVTAEELETRDGKIYSQKSPERSIMVADLFKPAVKGRLAEGEELLGNATFVKPGSGEDPETGQGKILVAFYIYGAQAVEVAVDTETGLVKILKFCSAFDMGAPINPKLCEGQMEGGAVMGIGSTLYEEMKIDKGRVLNPNFTDYRLPSSGDIPMGENMKSMIAAAPQQDGPYGAKGVGEGTMTITAPAIANAIYNAVGVRIMDLPITPEKVLAALSKKRRKE